MYGRHYYYFGKKLEKKLLGDKLNEENWDVLRNDNEEGPFSIENTIESYEKNCMSSESYIKVSKLIIKMLQNRNLLHHKIISCGVGKGILEWNLKRAHPELYLVCTDYTKNAINKLEKVFVNGDEFRTFDMMNGDYEEFNVDSILLFYRVSTEFDVNQWNTIFEKMYVAGVKYIVFVPSEIASKKMIMREKRRHIINRMRFRKDTFCGWIYSEDEFLNMFKGKGKTEMFSITESFDFEATRGYLLTRNSSISAG